MHILILTFQGFNELDSFIALGILNRVKKPDWRVHICCPEEYVTSMNGVTVKAQSRLDEVANADAVLIGSGIGTRDVAASPDIMDKLRLDPSRQLVGAQCSGTLLLAKLGLLKAMPACTDLITKPWVQETGVQVLDQPFHASKNIATAGGCMASTYLGAWFIARTEGLDAASNAIHYVAPVGEKDTYVQRVISVIEPFV